MSCDHQLDPEYLYPADATVLEIRGSVDDVRLEIAVPCPACDEDLELEAVVEAVEEVDLDFSLGDAEESYD